MNILDRLNLAGRALVSLLDKSNDLLPTGGYEVAHDLGRWWDAVLRLEETTGFVVPHDMEVASLRNLKRLTDNPLGVLMNRQDIPCLQDRAFVNSHNFRETLLAMDGLVRMWDSEWARKAGRKVVGAMALYLKDDGHLDFATMAEVVGLPLNPDISQSEPERNGWFDSTATTGRALEALVRFSLTANEPSALAVAARIAEHQLATIIAPNGDVRPEIIGPENLGHDHSYLGTLRGLLVYGLVTGDRRYAEAVDRTYRNGVRNQILTPSGWAPHDLGKTRFPNQYGDPVTDPASTGDAAQIALWLALDCDCHDLLDDVERLVRARLLPSQITPADQVPGREFTPREMGAWAICDPSHGGKGCTPDVLAAVTHTLCDIYNNIVNIDDGKASVNLHFDYDNVVVQVRNVRDVASHTSIVLAEKLSLRVRVPLWATDYRVTVDGKPVSLNRKGSFVVIPDELLHATSVVELTHDLPERETVEVMPSGREYMMRWRGDEVVSCDPVDEPLPFHSGRASIGA